MDEIIRLDLAAKSRPEFEQSLRNGWQWLAHAVAFARSAVLLFREVESDGSLAPGKGGPWMFFAAGTNAGLALEIVLKGVCVADLSRPVLDSGDGIVSWLATHDLERLAREAGLTPGPEEAAFLRHAGRFSEQHGRYPVGRRASATKSFAFIANPSARKTFVPLFHGIAEALIGAHGLDEDFLVSSLRNGSWSA